MFARLFFLHSTQCLCVWLGKDMPCPCIYICMYVYVFVYIHTFLGTCLSICTHSYTLKIYVCGYIQKWHICVYKYAYHIGLSAPLLCSRPLVFLKCGIFVCWWFWLWCFWYSLSCVEMELDAFLGKRRFDAVVSSPREQLMAVTDLLWPGCILWSSVSFASDESVVAALRAFLRWEARHIWLWIDTHI